MGWLQRLAMKLGLRRSPVPLMGQCGAQALHASYQKLSLHSSVAEIWEKIKTPKESLGPGIDSSAGAFMCRDALARGLKSMYFQAKYSHALDLVTEARERGVQVIVLHGTDDPAWRHYSILNSAAPEGVELFDPSRDAVVPMSLEGFLELWGRAGDAGGGHYLLVLTPEKQAPTGCQTCGAAIPSEIRCEDSACNRTIPLGLGWMLGCLNRECPTATWEGVCCPFCRAELTELRSWNPW